MTARVKKSVGRRIFSIAVDVITVLLVLIIILLLYAKVSGKQVFSMNVLWVLSPSMEDTIPASSYILVRTVDPGKVEKGDIITFHSRDPALDGALNTHRVDEVIGDHENFRTKGDNNPIADQYLVYPEDITAIYVRNLPLLTFFGRFYSTPFGLAATLIVVMMIMSAWFSIFQKKQEKESKDAEIERRIAEEIERLRNDSSHSDDGQ